MRVLLGAHTIDPTRGGEPKIGWGWAESLARHPGVERIEVVAHPMARDVIEGRLRDDDLLASKLRFHWVLPPDRIDPWKGEVPGKKVWHRLLMHYQLWQRAAEQAARSLVDQVDVAHHVTFGNIFLRTFVTELPLPYLIGPVGGGQVPPVADALRLFGRSGDVHGALEVMRSVLVGPLGRRPAMKHRLSPAAAVLCANTQTLRIARRYQPRSELMIDGGIDLLPPGSPKRPSGRPIVIWVGKLEARKDPLAALDVAEALRKSLPSARLLIAGDGWLRTCVEQEVRKRSLTDTVELPGRVPHDQMEELYGSASLFLFTSLRDTFGVQNLEALTHGLPIVFRDSAGVAVGDFVGSAGVGVRGGVGWPADAARVIGRILQDRAEWEARSNAALAVAKGFTWAAKADRAVELYSQAIHARTQPTRG